ncbi:predicted protein [Streptomyces filamentosus NRRL 15998]|uniref:Predicted protein n=1 Tax=Streptomyces filamentosus NRRL 15998 TaxID=457431 RepID=D6ATC4_STRFL|nr:predicted protein [Streptomyces filamentosus NRRL 15998]
MTRPRAYTARADVFPTPSPYIPQSPYSRKAGPR